MELDKDTLRSTIMEMTFGAISFSHVNDNVPDKKDFDSFLLRDIKAYFHVSEQAVVKYELLRKGPSQVGVSCPEYYLWVDINDNGVQHTGAMQVYVLDKKRFFAQNYVSKEDLEKNFAANYNRFPLSICLKIADKVYQ